MSKQPAWANFAAFETWCRERGLYSIFTGLSAVTWNISATATEDLSVSSLPVFHLPVGHHRRTNGEVVPFESFADEDEAIPAWTAMVLNHPDTLAAGACIFITPILILHIDVSTRTATPSPTPNGAWKPSALNDWDLWPITAELWPRISKDLRNRGRIA